MHEISELPKQGAESPKILVGGHEAAKLLSVSAMTVYRLTKAGELPCVRIGRAVRYSPAALAAWAESQETACLPSQ